MANSVQTFSGHDGRNSSRVLRPPGGASSIFFNDDAAATGPPARRQPAAAPALVSEPAPTSPRRVTAPTHGKASSHMHGSHNVQVEAGKHRDVHTSSRVLAPPGGHTHNIFG
eukprot:TRINITY_DN10623_c0_g1_i1.p1 TRINITY_DN10623_c0_g1~~TRINITY_DN10623_c0_g1_i1.p1  ORF type:complete len:112 (+),score=22.20 TRINITY_DN10623_c0_g1_i1:179-514(+)